jgi:hypothetical protein
LSIAEYTAGSDGNKVFAAARVSLANALNFMFFVAFLLVSAAYQTLPAFSHERPPMAFAAR